MPQVPEWLEKAVKLYNRYRSPEATAEVVSVGGREFRVRFTGPFCRTCGFYDYFDDFKYELEDLGVRVSIVEVVEEVDGATVTFRVEGEAGENGEER